MLFRSEFILAGATAIGLGTGLFYDPMAIKKINAYISAYLKEKEVSSIADLVGRAHQD